MLNKNFDWEKVEPHTRFTGVPDGCDSLLLAELLEPGSQTILHISSDGVRMNQVADSVGFFLPDIEVLKFPAWDCLPYDRVPPRGDVVAERMATLAALAEGGSTSGRVLVVTTVAAVLQRVPPKSMLSKSRYQLSPGDRVDLGAIVAFLASNGYQ
ncbi:MAG: transcription-repair coupling factor, partial [Alphaproteobacteria bacterium]